MILCTWHFVYGLVQGGSVNDGVHMALCVNRYLLFKIIMFIQLVSSNFSKIKEAPDAIFLILELNALCPLIGIGPYCVKTKFQLSATKIKSTSF